MPFEPINYDLEFVNIHDAKDKINFYELKDITVIFSFFFVLWILYPAYLENSNVTSKIPGQVVAHISKHSTQGATTEG